MNVPKNDEMVAVEAAHDFLVEDWFRIHTKYPKLKKKDYDQYVKRLTDRLIHFKLTRTEFKNAIFSQCDLWKRNGL